ncbi:MAG: tRNA dihydrouridine synthase DusB [Oscillospiraceae bacterium]|nr:tRNA dihydrouridine synthase DusB [Oscillospiraceae bacterium]
MTKILEKLKLSACLAPMAGYTDHAFRSLCMGQGAAFCVTEMVSAKGLVQGNQTARALTAVHEDELPCAIQLFSDDAESMRRAVEIVRENIDAAQARRVWLDINCGCPARKVAGHGGGAALMRTPEKAAEIVRAAVQAAGDVPVSVKFRLGWDDESRNAVDFAQRMEAAGAALLTVHGRTRAQMYAPPVDLDAIAAVKRAVRVPVIGNGDVTDGASAKHMLDATGVDGVMLGRGALGRPWVFAQIAAYLRDGTSLPAPTPEERGAALLQHVQLLIADNGEPHGIRVARKTAAHYFKGMRGAGELRARVVRVQTLAELEEIVDEALRA